jgi:hypothetical protein
MTKRRLPWGHMSRTCVYCGKVGPRCVVAFGYAHKYCMSPDERAAYNRQNPSYKARHRTGA